LNPRIADVNLLSGKNRQAFLRKRSQAFRKIRTLSAGDFPPAQACFIKLTGGYFYT